MTDKKYERLEELLEKLLKRIEDVDRACEQLNSEEESDEIDEFIEEIEDSGEVTLATLLRQAHFDVKEESAEIIFSNLSKEKMDFIAKKQDKISRHWHDRFPTLRKLTLDLQPREEK
jgi:hypothetical protein